jgi:ABC-type lipoprotein release transport system permease subunit
MKMPWPLYLAWKQLFPSQRRVSFFSFLAVVGVALGVNVMIVVVAFMKGFQHKFREDIIDAQGHARAFPLKQPARWLELRDDLKSNPDVAAISPYAQSALLLQNRNEQSVPFSIGIDPGELSHVLPLDDFLQRGHGKMHSTDALDVTPVPTVDSLHDDVVLVSRYVANRLGVRPGAILRMSKGAELESVLDPVLGVRVARLDPWVPSGEWTLQYLGEKTWLLEMAGLGFEKKITEKGGRIDGGQGCPVFICEPSSGEPPTGIVSTYQTFASSTIEVFSPKMIERAKADEMVPPKEVKIGGIFEVPWQGFQAEALIGTMRFMGDLQGMPNRCDGFYLKFHPTISGSEEELVRWCDQQAEKHPRTWAFIPWFVENAWFFELLKFEEYLMILIMVPIGLVAAFAIAIALMTTVLRKIREIGLLVAMGGGQGAVGSIFCLQGFLIGALGAVLGCGLALLFIHYRHSIMSFIVVNIAGEEGQAGVAQFYDFYSLHVPYPWESAESLTTFITFACFAVCVSTIAGLLPAWRAARMNPADALRNE